MCENIITWKTIDRFLGLYEFCNNGEVRCLPKVKNGNRNIVTKGSITSGKKKYYVLSVTDINGNRKQEKVHRLIGEAHVSNPLNLPVINHLDNDGLNNNSSNLEWTTDLGNKEHAKVNGLMPKGEGHCLSKLNEKQVLEINKDKGLFCEIAKKYNVSASVISAIKRGNTWVSVTKNKKAEKVKLDKSTVISIFNDPLPKKELVTKYGVKVGLISGIKNGRRYTTVTKKEYDKEERKKLIIQISKSNGSAVEIAKRLKVSKSVVFKVKSGKVWSELTNISLVDKSKTTDHGIVLEIFNSNLTYHEISKKYNVSRKVISGIKTGYRHSNLTGKKFIKMRYYAPKV